MQPIPLTIIGGFLGAGKTTLLNYLLRGVRDRRVVVLVNDFGAINIDAELLAERRGDTISLANGCICCSIGDKLIFALIELLQRQARPEHLVIEASGVADPARIAEIGLADPSFRLDSVITVADAERVREQAADRHVGETVLRQLAAADIVVLNKLDLADDPPRDWLHKIAPQAAVVEAVRGEIPLEILVGVGASPRAAADTYHHDPAFDTWSFASDRPFDRARLRQAIEGLPVIRAKGVLLLADDPRRAVFQLVGSRWELIPGEPWGSTLPGSRLVVIGVSFDAAELERRFGAALV